jgi:hypothetical protein
MSNSKYAALEALYPFFDIVMQGWPAQSMATTISKRSPTTRYSNIDIYSLAFPRRLRVLTR